MKLHRFNGGLKLPSDKAPSLLHPIVAMPLVERLYLSIQPRHGSVCTPIISVGDPVTRGQVLATYTTGACVPVLASSAGVITDIDEGHVLTMSTLPDIAVPPARLNGARDFAQQLHAGAITGLGGAAFPASAKIDSIADRHPDFLIINAAECEPIISCDQALMREYATDMVTGIHILMEQTGAARCLIGIEDNKPEEISLLERALASGDDAWPEGSVSVIPVPTRYPTGGERQLIRVLTGRKVPYGRLPRDIGVVCFNIATALAVKRLIVDSEPLVSRVVTVAGSAIAQPRNVHVAFGTPHH